MNDDLQHNGRLSGPSSRLLKAFYKHFIHLQRLLGGAEIIADRSYYKFGGKQTEGSLAVSLSYRKGVEFRRQVANFRPDQYDINLSLQNPKIPSAL